MLDDINAQLEAKGANFRVAMAEYVTHEKSDELGQVIFAKDRGNRRLVFDFVPADPLRGNRVNITYVVDLADGTTANGLTAAETEGAIDNAMATWDAQTCSDLQMTKNPSLNFDVGVVQAILGFGGIPAFLAFADVIHAGWLPGAFFEALRPGGATEILGITFTIIFVDGAGNPVDRDGNGRGDAAFREIYYNDNFGWGIDVPGFFPVFDVETVALHEAGHGISQGHFGKIFRTIANGKLHFSPVAVMNAAVFGQKQELLGTDVGGHCNNWANWPNN
ncbi:MAG: hypothetical protein ACREMK_05955 [Gemmatimonadota bacterium]